MGKKVKKMYNFVATVLFDIMMHSDSNPYVINESRSFGDLGQSSLVIAACQIFLLRNY